MVLLQAKIHLVNSVLIPKNIKIKIRSTNSLKSTNVFSSKPLKIISDNSISNINDNLLSPNLKKTKDNINNNENNNNYYVD